MPPSYDDEVAGVVDPDQYWNMPPPIIKAPEGAQHGKSGVYYGGKSHFIIIYLFVYDVFPVISMTLFVYFLHTHYYSYFF